MEIMTEHSTKHCDNCNQDIICAEDVDFKNHQVWCARKNPKK